jgi:hypothetical protein
LGLTGTGRESPGSGGQVLVFVEARFDVSPRDVEVLVGGHWRRWRRRVGNQPILMVAPYIGPRVRELLIEENVSYVDLTGNVRTGSLAHRGPSRPGPVNSCGVSSWRWAARK